MIPGDKFAESLGILMLLWGTELPFAHQKILRPQILRLQI